MGDPSAARADRRDPSWRAPAICIALAAMSFAVFASTLGCGFVNYDDNEYVYDNPIVARGLTLKGLKWAFTSVRANNWHPVTWLSHMLDCQLYALHPAGHHLTNLLLHVGTVIALFLVLREMTGFLWRSAFVAAIFAIHPLRVESVAWISERKDVLSGLFFVLSIWAYVRYARRPRSLVGYAVLMLLFALGLMSKPMLVTLPLLLLLLDYWPLQRTESLGKLVLEKLPLLALSAASCGVTLLAQRGAIQSTDSFSLPLRFENALVSCMVYLRQMAYPAGLAVFYPYPSHLPALEVVLAGVLIGGISFVAWLLRRKQPWIVVGWLWYLTMLLPVAGIVQVGMQAHADRYTYLPQIGIYIGLTWLVAQWHMRRELVGSLMAVLIAILMVCAFRQTAYWHDSETLWTHTLACTTGNDMAHNNLGTAFLNEGKVEQAIQQFAAAMEIKPGDADAHYSLGTALLQSGRVKQAIVQFKAAIQIMPDDADAHYNLALALRQEGNIKGAIAQFQSALKFDPHNAGAEYNLAVALRQVGNVDGAIAHYQKAIQLNPTSADAHNNLANALLQQGKVDEAIAHFQTALQIDPGSAKAHNNLGNALLKKGNASEAIAQFDAALQIETANPAFQNNLAWILATWPDASVRNGLRAVDLAERANQASGGKDPLILRTLAAALAEAGRYSDAVETAQGALSVAREESNSNLGAALQSEIILYQNGKPFRVSGTVEPKAP
ncbi:MAG TPA: tetratricopeptide repeat protein [Verrucomicrobiae bacterium]|nr:tetratricopeptide repeat protein [Verrucomicrobiae bacterium]